MPEFGQKEIEKKQPLSGTMTDWLKSKKKPKENSESRHGDECKELQGISDRH